MEVVREHFVNLPREGMDDISGNVDISEKDRRNGYSRMDYVFPKKNPRNTAPGNKLGVDSELRSAQIQLRLAEIEEAYHVMGMIHAGDGKSVAKASPKNKSEGQVSESSRGLRRVN
jgi:platelet-activating factor acetylhydrolase